MTKQSDCDCRERRSLGSWSGGEQEQHDKQGIGPSEVARATGGTNSLASPVVERREGGEEWGELWLGRGGNAELEFLTPLI